MVITTTAALELCALSGGGLLHCASCAYRPKAVPAAGTPQHWFTPLKGIATCVSHSNPVVGARPVMMTTGT